MCELWVLEMLGPELGFATQKSNILHITLKNSNALHYTITPWRN